MGGSQLAVDGDSHTIYLKLGCPGDFSPTKSVYHCHAVEGVWAVDLGHSVSLGPDLGHSVSLGPDLGHSVSWVQTWDTV